MVSGNYYRWPSQVVHLEVAIRHIMEEHNFSESIAADLDWSVHFVGLGILSIP